MKWEEITVQDMQFENMKVVLAALFKHLDLTLEEYRWHDGGHDFRVTKAIQEDV